MLPSESDIRTLNRPYLGIRLRDGDDGVVISSVADGSPAAEAGLRVGDVVRSLGGRQLEQRRDLREIMADLGPGDTIEVVVVRDGEELIVRPTLRKP